MTFWLVEMKTELWNTSKDGNATELKLLYLQSVTAFKIAEFWRASEAIYACPTKQLTSHETQAEKKKSAKSLKVYENFLRN